MEQLPNYTMGILTSRYNNNSYRTKQDGKSSRIYWNVAHLTNDEITFLSVTQMLRVPVIQDIEHSSFADIPPSEKWL